MQEVLIFSGTTEGRNLAEILCSHGVTLTVCVATEYGQEVMEETSGLEIRIGRLTQEEMEQLIDSRNWAAVVDATHPYAKEVTEHIQKACKRLGREVLRLIRAREPRAEENQHIIYADTPKEAAEYLNGKTGNIFFTTGSKDLPEYIKRLEQRERIFVRILPGAQELERCHALGLKGKQIICMQGPFSEALNYAMLKEVNAAYLVTKETAAAGGYQEKIAAAQKAGICSVVIKRPEESGYSMKEILRKLHIPDSLSEKEVHTITLVGIGMGGDKTMTREAWQACEQAQLLVGAARMLAALPEHIKQNKTTLQTYRGEELAGFLKENLRYQKVVVLLSGDVGFYSGAKKMLEVLQQEKLDQSYQIHMICGISSVVYFASRLGIAWEDMKLMSLHGRSQNLAGTLRISPKVFTLTDGVQGIRRLSRELLSYGFGFVDMYVGRQLGSAQEEILNGKPQDFTDCREEGLYVALLVNPKAENACISHGMKDEAFIRDKVPMTKEEVRSISISKMQLCRNAVVYDIGAGTGSISVECSRIATEGQVYAIEKNPQAVKLLEQNKYACQAGNLELIAGEAPKILEALPVPTHAFIGGSSGKLEEILTALWKKNLAVRVVLNVIALETLAEVVGVMKKYPFISREVVQVSIARGKELGDYQMMMGQNPVYVITLQRK